MLDHSQAMATVQRFEADSKFFRSLLIVLFVMLVTGLATGRLVIALISAAFLILAFWRYVDQRSKSTTQAYWYVITEEAKSEGGYRRPAPDQARWPSHAGGVVYRIDGENPKYLLVRAKYSREWVLPKGHVEPGEPMRETAVREVREETGVWGRIAGELKPVSYPVNGSSIQVQFYLMEKLEEGRPSESREPTWFDFDQAFGCATHSETRDLLGLAKQSLPKLQRDNCK